MVNLLLMTSARDLFQKTQREYHRLRKEQGHVAALSFARALTDPPNCTDLYAPIRAAALVDCGSVTRDLEALQEGEREWRRLRQVKDAPTNQYNHANAVSSLFAESAHQQGLFVAWMAQREQLRESRLEYLQLAENEASPREAARAYVNLGNSYEATGRHLEALDLYDRALVRSPGFAMALGNRGYALMSYSGYYGAHRPTILARAHMDLKAACDAPDELVDESGPEALRRLREALSRWNEAPPPPRHAAPRRADPYQAWCQDHNLLLHVSPSCLGDEAGLDPLFFKTVRLSVTAFEATPVPEVFFAFNTMKNEYAAARWLAWTSTTKNQLSADLANWSQVTRYLDTLDYARYDLFSGLARQAFNAATNLLDKIGAFLVLYFGLSAEPRQIYFGSWYMDGKTIFASAQKSLEHRPYNFGLWALTDLSFDVHKRGRYSVESSLRNTATHRFLGLHEYGSPEATLLSEHRPWHDFKMLLLGQLRLARYALTYLVAAIDSSERAKREDDESGKPRPTLSTVEYKPLPQP
jgi:tetratricopeptide (TPR) repeat protein